MQGNMWLRAMAVMCAVVVGLATPTGGTTQVNIETKAQISQAAAPAQDEKRQVPALRVTTRVVQVNVIAQDKKGQPVTELTKDDFVLTDAGREESIRFFSMESSGKIEKAAQTQPSPANTYTNRPEVKTGAPTSVTVILFDALNTQFSDMAYAKQQILKFLAQVQPNDRVALYTLGSQLKVLHDFTNDAAPLVRAVKRFRGEHATQLEASTPEVADTESDDLNAVLDLMNQRVADFYTTNRALRTTAALEAIAQHLSNVPGRKNLVWVSGSFPFNINFDTPMTPDNASLDRRSFHSEVERAARALNDANLAIYPVDARGLMTFAAFNPDYSAAAPSRLGGIGPPSLRAGPPRGNFDTMRRLAELTGGRAFYNTNDIYGSVREAVDDARVTYVVGYYPSHGEWNGKFHEIKVQVKRPGVRLRYRRGYFAVGEQPTNQRQNVQYLTEAAESVLDATSLGLTVEARWVNVPGAERLKLVVHIERQDVQFEEKNARWAGGLDILYVSRNEEGQTLGMTADHARMNLRRETYEGSGEEGLTFTKELPVKPGTWQLRVVVRDAGSGATGSVTIPVGKLIANDRP